MLLSGTARRGTPEHTRAVETALLFGFEGSVAWRPGWLSITLWGVVARAGTVNGFHALATAQEGGSAGAAPYKIARRDPPSRCYCWEPSGYRRN